LELTHPHLLIWNGVEDVDARNKCGHDESETVAIDREEAKVDKMIGSICRGC
jgi:hypothetical protein